MTKKISISILILIVIAAIGWGYYAISKRTAKVAVNNSIEPIENKIGETASEFLGVTFDCDSNLTSKADKQKCADKLNKVLNSKKENCQYFSSETDKKLCEQSYAVKEIQVSGDMQGCTQLPEKERDNCTSQVAFSLAIAKKDKEYCKYIKNKTDIETCDRMFSSK